MGITVMVNAKDYSLDYSESVDVLHMAGAVIGLMSLGFAETMQLTFGERVLLLGWRRSSVEQKARGACLLASLLCLV